MSSTQDKEQVVLDSWDTPLWNTRGRRERTKKWKPALLELAEQVHQAMLQFKPDPQSKLKAQWYISDGSYWSFQKWSNDISRFMTLTTEFVF